MKAKAQDLKSALDFLKQQCTFSLIPYNDTPQDWKKAHTVITKEFKQALLKAKLKTISSSQLKKIPLFDHGRRPSKYLKNPIIIAVVNNQQFVIDGNHRAITALESGIKSLPAIEIQLSADTFESLSDCESNYKS